MLNNLCFNHILRLLAAHASFANPQIKAKVKKSKSFTAGEQAKKCTMRQQKYCDTKNSNFLKLSISLQVQ
jgi:hypothetical protein